MSYTEPAVEPCEVSSERELVLRTLRAVLDSPHFCKSRRYPALLEFAVRSALEKSTETVKERTVGIKVFGRPTDYDTGNDSVVRIAAGEVRKRLALYFGEHPEAPVRIDLPLGTYKAEFHFRPPVESGSSLRILEGPAPETSSPHDEIVPTPAAPTARNRRWWIAGGVVSALLLICAIAVGLWQHLEGKAEREFWSPVLQADESARILVGQTNASTPVPAGQATSAGSVSAPDLALDDAIVTGHVCSVFREYGRDCTIISARLARLEDLKNRSLVLVGGFNNPWTLRLMASLPYQLQFDNSQGGRLVVEHSAARDLALGRIGDEDSSSAAVRDYAVIARFHSDVTDSMAVVVAGLGIPGTNGAGQYLSSPEKLHQLLSAAPKDWKGVNFEAVLKVDVVEGSPGQVQLVSSRFW